MRFERAVIPSTLAWTSPFARWQGSLADVSSLDLAVAVTGAAMSRRGIEPGAIGGLVVGLTIPQPRSFYAAPWLASRLGLPGLTGPAIAQACATSVAAVVSAAMAVDRGDAAAQLVIATDRTSNGPLLVYPSSLGMGGSPVTEHWVLDSFAADPNTGESMVATAEHVAREGGFDRQALDELTLLRWEQYRTALADDRAIQKRYVEPIVVRRRKGSPLEVGADEGVHPYTAEGLAGLRPVTDAGVVTFGTQTHPADGCAGAVVTARDRAQAVTATPGPVARVLAAGFVRVEQARMPKAAAVAALAALDEAGVGIDDVRCVVTHNPFAVNDLWFARQTGFPVERMNPYGSSLIYGHPQGPTGLRGIAELIQALLAAGGGIGVFSGCAAGDTGAALVLRID